MPQVDQLLGPLKERDESSDGQVAQEEGDLSIPRAYPRSTRSIVSALQAAPALDELPSPEAANADIRKMKVGTEQSMSETLRLVRDSCLWANEPTANWQEGSGRFEWRFDEEASLEGQGEGEKRHEDRDKA